MTNEEAFEKWAIDYGLDYEPSFTRYDVEAAWQAAIAYMQEQSEPLPPIEYDQEMDRWYIPMIGGWEIQTKGKGSTFRICNTKTHVRWPVLDEHLHEALEQMAKDNRHAYTTPQRQQPLKRLDEDRIDEIFTYFSDTKGNLTIDNWHLLASVFMDAMQEINK